MGDIVGKSSVIIIIILVALVVGVIFLPQLGQFTLRFGAETLTVVDTSAQRTPDSDGTIDLKMITILGREGIPAILDPVFARQGAESNMEPAERVIGVSINGESRAYPINLMSRHEIVNDTVGGQGHRCYLVTPLLHGHCICPRDRGEGAHIWGVGQTDHERSGHVRPPVGHPVEPVPEPGSQGPAA